MKLNGKYIYIALKIGFALFCLVFGADKFLKFSHSCSLEQTSNDIVWKIIGVIEIAIGMSLLLNKYVSYFLSLAIVVFTIGIISHLNQNTYDIGGAVFLLIYAIVLLYFNKGIIMG